MAQKCCCRINVCPLTPKFVCWNPNPQGDGVRRWGLWEVIRSLVKPLRWDWCPYKRDPRDPWSFCPVRTQQAGTTFEPGSVHWLCRCLDHGLPSLQNCENQLLLCIRHPSLWYFCCSSPARLRRGFKDKSPALRICSPQVGNTSVSIKFTIKQR